MNSSPVSGDRGNLVIDIPSPVVPYVPPVQQSTPSYYDLDSVWPSLVQSGNSDDMSNKPSVEETSVVVEPR